MPSVPSAKEGRKMNIC
uniref:Uncharacterized protein n=1 Tax=Arundo donax TaxID=35708 RepID=A0A0A9CK68_ARUDO